MSHWKGNGEKNVAYFFWLLSSTAGIATLKKRVGMQMCRFGFIHLILSNHITYK
jgi:hypothetical protein